ncbi:MAG TPA: alpha/beta hydrolase [Solirubrobacteraceae bacterium]
MALFCLLHGAWHDGACWEPLVGALAPRGHEAIAPDLPFHDPRTTYAQRIQPALDALADAHPPVVVVGHSMGARYAPFVADAISAWRLVLLCPALNALREGFPFPPRRPDGTTEWDRQSAIDVMYPRPPAATARAAAQRLRPMAHAADQASLERDLPATVVYTADDEFFAPEEELRAARARPFTEVIEMPGGHFPMLEDPEALADLLDRIAHVPTA